MTLRPHFRQLGKARKGGRFIGFNKQRSMRQTQPEGTQFGGELAVKNGQVPGRGASASRLCRAERLLQSEWSDLTSLMFDHPQVS